MMRKREQMRSVSRLEIVEKKPIPLWKKPYFYGVGTKNNTQYEIHYVNLSQSGRAPINPDRYYSSWTLSNRDPEYDESRRTKYKEYDGWSSSRSGRVPINPLSSRIYEYPDPSVTPRSSRPARLNPINRKEDYQTRTKKRTEQTKSEPPPTARDRRKYESSEQIVYKKTETKKEPKKIERSVKSDRLYSIKEEKKPETKPSLVKRQDQPPDQKKKPQKAVRMSDEVKNEILEPENKKAAASERTVDFKSLGEFVYGSAPKVLSYKSSEKSSGPKEVKRVERNSNLLAKKRMFSELSAEDCRTALSNWANNKKLKDRNFVKYCQIDKVIGFNSLEYVLETFTEKRSLESAYKPYSPQVDKLSPLGNNSPDPWQVHSEPSLSFQDETKKIAFANTDVIKECFMCKGKAFLKCIECKQSGEVTCAVCKGEKAVLILVDKKPTLKECPNCSGQGIKSCVHCIGKGRVVCNTCHGYRQLRWFLQITVAYTNHVDKYINVLAKGESVQLPEQVRNTAKTDLIAKEEGEELSPMQSPDNPDIGENSHRLLQKSGQNNSERRILQRHSLSGLVCHECHAEYKGTKFKFWVYGADRKVHCPQFDEESSSK